MHSIRTLGRLFVLVAGILVVTHLPGLRAAPISNVDTQLQKIFERMDKDLDGNLDELEVAHAFRGRNATAPPPLYDEKGNMTIDSKTAERKYPDLAFRWKVDKDSDDKISWQEYQEYAKKLIQERQQLLTKQQQAMRTAYTRAMQLQRVQQQRMAQYARQQQQAYQRYLQQMRSRQRRR